MTTYFLYSNGTKEIDMVDGLENDGASEAPFPPQDESKVPSRKNAICMANNVTMVYKQAEHKSGVCSIT